jgi:hypothetical protein
MTTHEDCRQGESQTETLPFGDGSELSVSCQEFVTPQ